MQRSSESIASLAAALAKAQTQLINPEKSLVATVSPEGSDGAERRFRYASLASGLDIVRKILGQHEIAVVQMSAIDHTAGIVNLTTVLAHASGEWIASDWPICAISETTTPHRMGAALTYARRYALFTLVGIAGEDDLDAPDLMTPTSQSSAPGDAKRERGRGQNGANQDPAPQKVVRRRAGAKVVKPALAPEASVHMRDQLLVDLADLKSDEEAVIWAYRSLSTKNDLTAADARLVEDAFQAKLGLLRADRSPTASNPAESDTQVRSGTVDKSVLAFSAPRRMRDRAHMNLSLRSPA
jgi:hypothetical protein